MMMDSDQQSVRAHPFECHASGTHARMSYYARAHSRDVFDASPVVSGRVTLSIVGSCS